MPRHISGGKNYSQRLKSIRTYVNFNYDLRKPLSSAAKAKINKYYDYIDKLTVRDHFVYRARSKKNLNTAQRYSQQNTHYKDIKVAFVPKGTDKRPRVKFSAKGEMTLVGDNVTRHAILFDKEELIEADANGEAEEYIESVIDDAPTCKRYSVMAGEFEIPLSTIRDKITNEVLRLMNTYSAEKFNPEQRSSHYFGNWLFGVNGYNFANQDQLIEYRTRQRKIGKENSRAKVNARKKEKRAAATINYWLNDSNATAKQAHPPQPPEWRKVSQREYFRHVYKLGYRELRDGIA